MSKARTTTRAPETSGSSVLLAIVGLMVCVLWSHWATVVELCTLGARNHDYLVGPMVPLAALYVAWRRRVPLYNEGASPCWWGLALLGLSEAMRMTGVYLDSGSVERYSLVVAIMGVVLLAAGWNIFRRLIWVQAMLVLMVPLPGRIHESIALPLQEKATSMAAFTLELLGYFVIREGHVLRLGERTVVAVTEACSGLRMLTALIFVVALLVLMINRPRWQKATLLLLSIPIAVLANALRATCTAIIVYQTQDASLSGTFHDVAGLAMMPAALLVAMGVLKFFDLFITVTPESPTASRTTRGGGGSAGHPGLVSGVRKMW